MPLVKVDLQLPLDHAPRRRLRVPGGAAASLQELLRDPPVVAVLTMAVLTLVLAIYLDTSLRLAHRAVRTNIEVGLRDSTKLAVELQTAADLQKKRTAYEARMKTVEAIDRGRYAFPHLLDQAASALTPNMWLTSVAATAYDTTSGTIAFAVTGYAPSNEAVSTYVQQLEMSPFAANVQLRSLAHATVNQQALFEFVVVGSSETPEAAYLELETIASDGTRAVRSATSGPGAPPAGGFGFGRVDSLIGQPPGTPAATPAGPLPSAFARP